MENKKFIKDNIKLMNFWDSEKNSIMGYNPSSITCGTHSKFWWKCSMCGDSFMQRPNDLLHSNLNVCKNCANKMRRISNVKSRLKKGTSLSKSNPELAKEWVECEIEGIGPNDVTSKSKLYVIWKCPKCKGFYKAIIANRTDKHSACPYCANQKVLKGYNDFQTKFPDIAKTWSEKNKIKPDEVTSHSNKVVYWKCEYGHDDYLKSVKLRILGQGCQKCANAMQTSFPEQAIYFYLKQIFPDTINRYKVNKKYEVDIFIPQLNAGIEYNGYFYHKAKTNFDDNKKIELTKFGINIIVINEIHNKKIAENKADLFIKDNYNAEEFKNLFESILNKLRINKDIDVDIIRDGIQIRKQYMFFVKENSIAEKNPKIVKEWSFEKNGNIKPDFVPYGSSQKFWWKCLKCGQEFYSTPKQRFLGKGCPYCSHKKVKSGVNDLASKYPNLLKEWDFVKNSISPSEIYGGGRTQCYWICKLGHSYKCRINDKVKGVGCPYCSGKKILIGFNDLESKKPELLLDWDYNKNKILPNEIHYNSFKKVNWKCHKCGFEWQHNVIEKNKCPKCVKNENIINVYDLNANFIGRYDGVKSLCKNFDINPKSHGNISSICERKQKTLKSKYLLRYNKDDEFKGLNNKERKKKIDSYLGNVDDYKYKLNPQINIYDIIKKEFVKQCNNLNEAFDFLEIKSKSNIVTVCKRKQKTIKNRYILRYDVDDEFKNLTKNSLKKAIDGFIGNYNYFKNR